MKKHCIFKYIFQSLSYSIKNLIFFKIRYTQANCK